jgi:hypothetical protein
MKLVRRLTEGVAAWLQFETHCNRRGMFSEKYLSVPIGQILGAVYGSHVRAEVLHPILAPHQSGPGARTRVDFAALGDNNQIVAAVESKWIGATRPSIDKIAWDLLRLELLAAHHRAECCFLLGGTKKDLTHLFGSADFRGRTIGYRKPLLPLAPGVLDRCYIRAAPHYRRSMHRQVLEPWQELPIAEMFELVATAPSPVQCVADQYQIYGWSILATRSRKEFRPSQSKHYRRVPSNIESDT